MNAQPVVVEGIVEPDGTLKVEGKVSLPAGKVRVTVEELPWTFEDHPFWKMLQEIWATHDQEEAEPHPRTAEEMQAEYQRYLTEELVVHPPPAKVPVEVQPELTSFEDHPFWKMLQEIWANAEKAGLKPRSEEEVEAARKEFRDGIEEEIAEAGRLQDESRRSRIEAKRANKEAQ